MHNSIGYSHERPLLLPPPGRWAPDRAFGGCGQAGVRGGPTQGHFPRSVARPVKALSHRGPLSTCARLQGPKEPLVLKRGRKGRGSRHAASSAVAVGGSARTECRWPRRTQRGPAAVPAAGRGALSRLVAPGPTRAPMLSDPRPTSSLRIRTRGRSPPSATSEEPLATSHFFRDKGGTPSHGCPHRPQPRA